MRSHHAEALMLAQRLERSNAGSAADDRRALLLYWYGSGASHLRAEEEVLIAAWERHGGADHPFITAVRGARARLADQAARIAADPKPSSFRLSLFGRALAMQVHRVADELAALVARSVPKDELDEIEALLDDLRFPGARAGHDPAASIAHCGKSAESLRPLPLGAGTPALYGPFRIDRQAAQDQAPRAALESTPGACRTHWTPSTER